MLRVQVVRALACALVLLACDGPGESKTVAPAEAEAPRGDAERADGREPSGRPCAVTGS